MMGGGGGGRSSRRGPQPSREAAPEGCRPRRAAPGRRGLGERAPRGWRRARRGPLPGRRVTPPLRTGGDVQPPPRAPKPQHRPPPRVIPTPTPTRPRRRPLQAAQDTGPAASPEGSAVPGEAGSWAAACPQGEGRRAARGSAGAPHEQSGAASGAEGAEQGVLTGGRGPGGGVAGWGAGRGRRPRAAGAPRRGRRAGFCGRGCGSGCGSGSRSRSAGAGSGARQPGQRRRRLPLLLPGSADPRVLLRAGSPPPPQPRRCTGFSSPSRPGRPQGQPREAPGCRRSPQLSEAIFNPPPARRPLLPRPGADGRRWILLPPRPRPLPPRRPRKLQPLFLSPPACPSSFQAPFLPRPPHSSCPGSPPFAGGGRRRLRAGARPPGRSALSPAPSRRARPLPPLPLPLPLPAAPEPPRRKDRRALRSPPCAPGRGRGAEAALIAPPEDTSSAPAGSAPRL